MSRTWTKAQQNAISARGGTILVSAAAGSGKTAVLVERVIARLMDEENPCRPSELLIVTFTNAAAGEMRERIYNALTKEIAKNPTNSYLLRQKMEFANARICTIDSFTGDLVRENFHVAGVSPTFRIIDTAEKTQMYDDAMAQVMDELYDEGDAMFAAMQALFVSGGRDTALEEILLKIYNYSRAFYSPTHWFNNLVDVYKNADTPLTQTPWGQEVFRYIKDGIYYTENLITHSIQIMENDELYSQYGELFETLIENITVAKEIAAQDDWDKLYSYLETILVSTLGRAKAYDGDPLLLNTIQKNYKKVRAMYHTGMKPTAKLLFSHMGATQSAHTEDMKALYPVVKKLIEAVKRFEEILWELKKDKDIYEFSDVTHLALSLLVGEDTNGNPKRTPLALEYSKTFKEIMLDEYQDTNLAQDMIFTSLSDNKNNLFMVGDVKQSIYRFRQAMPEIFLKHKETYTPYDENSPTYPATITFKNNFRSRENVLETTNFLFRQIMSKQVGEMEYTAEEELVPSLDYDDIATGESEIHVLEVGAYPDHEHGKIKEYTQIAKAIKNMVEVERFSVGLNENKRPVQYRDISILMRSVRKEATLFAEIFEKEGVPLYTELSGGFFETREIQFVVSYLQILDNPLQDIPLTAVLLSAPYGFTLDALAEIRLCEDNVSLYSALLLVAKSGNEKAVQFLEDYKILQRLSIASPPSDTLRAVYNKTGCTAVFRAMDGGELRGANLNKLLTISGSFEESGVKSISDFVRYLEHAQDNSDEFSPAATLPETANVVRLMTIHKSKGLEFPVCIVAGLGQRFGGRSDSVALHPEYGIALERRKEETLQKFKTVPLKAIELANKRLDVSEEMRVLYVAMTRAREKLMLFIRLNNVDKTLPDYSTFHTDKEGAEPFAILSAGRFGEWILSAMRSHKDGQIVRDYAGESGNISSGGGDIKLIVSDLTEMHEEESTTETALLENVENAELYSEIAKRVHYEYPYKALANVSAKLSASSLKESEPSFEYFATSQPAFLDKTGLTPAQRGVATHEFMQYCNFEKARESVEAELERLVQDEFLSREQADAVLPDKIKAFFESTTYNRMQKAERMYREYEFTVGVSAGEYNPNLPDNLYHEQVLIQGIADCVFIESGQGVVVDYKTDRVKNMNDLVERYKDQLVVYKNAVEQTLGLPVKEMALYSFWLDDVIIVK